MPASSSHGRSRYCSPPSTAPLADGAALNATLSAEIPSATAAASAQHDAVDEATSASIAAAATVGAATGAAVVPTAVVGAAVAGAEVEVSVEAASRAGHLAGVAAAGSCALARVGHVSDRSKAVRSAVKSAARGDQKAAGRQPEGS